MCCKLKNDMAMIIKGYKQINKFSPRLLILCLIRSVFSSISPFINIILSGMIVNAIINKEPLSHLLILVSAMVSLNLILQLVSSLLNHVFNVANSRFVRVYNFAIDRKIRDMDFADVESSEIHNMRQRIHDYQNWGGGGLETLVWRLPEFTSAIFSIIFSVGLAFSAFTTCSNSFSSIVSFIATPYFSIIVFALIIGNVFFTIKTSSKATKKSYEIGKEFLPINRLFHFYSDFINNYKNGKEIRLYNQSEYILEQGFSQIMEKGVKINLKMTGMNVKYSSFREIFSIVMGTIIYIFVAIKSLLGLFSIGTIVQYIGSINRFVDGFISVVTAFTDLRNSCEPLKLYFDFMELPNKMQQGNFHVQKKDNKYEIEFKNVSFKYPGTENFVLENLNFKLRNGERMAVVGMNGSGKTTMIKLLCRLYDPTQGQITLNGIDIKNYNYNEYMSVFGIIFQDFKLFSFSLGQNIAASVDYDKTKAVNCLTTVGFYDRLKDMPKNLDTCLYKDFEDDGVEISGGEAQKIAMARALYKDAPILILDEPTAALDPIAEYKIYSKFNEIVEQKTTIYISHRLSSCRFCNDIAVFHEEKLLQRGSHNTLIADKNGKYFELWNAQAQYYNK